MPPQQVWGTLFGHWSRFILESRKVRQAWPSKISIRKVRGITLIFTHIEFELICRKILAVPRDRSVLFVPIKSKAPSSRKTLICHNMEFALNVLKRSLMAKSWMMESLAFLAQVHSVGVLLNMKRWNSSQAQLRSSGILISKQELTWDMMNCFARN